MVFWHDEGFEALAWYIPPVRDDGVAFESFFSFCQSITIIGYGVSGVEDFFHR